MCNHPLLTYAEDNGAFNEMVIRQCGKMLVLDRVLIKLFLTGHRCVGGGSGRDKMVILSGHRCVGQEGIKWSS